MLARFFGEYYFAAPSQSHVLFTTLIVTVWLDLYGLIDRGAPIATLAE